MAKLSLRGRGAVRGQAMVEFMLVLPMFLLTIVAFIEFAFAFSTTNALNYVARNVALVVAEGGSRTGTDCTALTILERDFGETSNRAGIASVEVYFSDENGNVINGELNRYDRAGTLSCTDLDRTGQTLPYTAATTAYAESARCSVLAGCGGTHPRLDTVGVRITYQYGWKTPLSGLLGFLGSPTFVATQQMRMEPVL